MQYIITLTPGSGIGSIVIGLVNALAYMRTNNINNQLLININKASTPGSALFTSFLDLDNISFLKIVNIPINVILNKETKRHDVITPGNYTDLWYRPISQQNYSFDMKCKIFDSFWLMNPDIDNYLKIHTNEYKSTDVCINIRRGDKVKLEPHLNQGSVQEFIDAVEKIPDVKTVFHTSDDYSTYLEFKNKKPEWNINTFCTLNDAGFFLKDLNELNHTNSTIINHVQKFLTEVEIMKNATWFIGTKTTNVGLMVELLRKNQKTIFIY